MNTVRKDIISGITYTAISKYMGMVISLIVTGILARLISPSEFGIIAIATVIIAFFGMFSDLGIAPAIVQYKDLDKEALSDIFSFTTWTGLVISVVFFSLSWLIADYYNSAILVTICQILSVNLFFASVNIVPYALLLRNKEFKYIAYMNLSVQFIGGTISVVAAIYGAGLYALLINPLFSSIVLFILGFRKYPQKIKRTMGFSSMRKIYSYSLYQFLFDLINYFSRNLDKLFIGKYLGLSALGYYEKSYRLMMLPLQNITHVITPVMHPVFSEFQHDLKHLSWSYLKIVRLLSFLGFPLSIFLWFSAHELILVIFGPQWERSVAVFQILALSVGIQIILSTSGSIFQAANDTRNLFISGLLSAIMNIGGMITGIFFFQSLEAVAWCILISFFINFIQCFILMYKVTFRINMQSFWMQLISPLVLSMILFVLLWVSTPFFKNMNMIMSLFMKGTLWILVSGLYVQLTKEYNLWKEIRPFVLKIKSFKKK